MKMPANHAEALSRAVEAAELFKTKRTKPTEIMEACLHVSGHALAKVDRSDWPDMLKTYMVEVERIANFYAETN
ncbi:hypothetical protein [Bradyrhizobium sp.]|uniref:hypothetical protein n=1 Tax=Bradyrhizobium sp. TaxID=376 RepID=UPI002D69F66A|nr:hypothetical protein [Bradyrhizobium sp.]HZR74547.1 hypothetical protein [Bradyrhizobium sp.]